MNAFDAGTELFSFESQKAVLYL